MFSTQSLRRRLLFVSGLLGVMQGQLWKAGVKNQCTYFTHVVGLDLHCIALSGGHVQPLISLIVGVRDVRCGEIDGSSGRM
ncbi:hypothetical protein F4777DRAFT_548933 [Nemania sp. FL0916]|nr:hypothetical protein F4777DRAFT_548933 [Nemania sp. FL0916]